MQGKYIPSMRFKLLPRGHLACHPYEATPPITKITLVADLVFCADSQWCLCARGGAGIGRGGEEGEGGRQGAARVARCKVGT